MKVMVYKKQTAESDTKNMISRTNPIFYQAALLYDWDLVSSLAASGLFTQLL